MTAADDAARQMQDAAKSDIRVDMIQLFDDYVIFPDGHKLMGNLTMGEAQKLWDARKIATVPDDCLIDDETHERKKRL
jgi:hypothetical protein